MQVFIPIREWVGEEKALESVPELGGEFGNLEACAGQILVDEDNDELHAENAPEDQVGCL